MIRDGDVDFVLAGGVDTCIIPEIIHGFENMNATIKIKPGDRAHDDPARPRAPSARTARASSCPRARACSCSPRTRRSAHTASTPKAEVLGVGWNSDAHHFTRPNSETIIRLHEAGHRGRRPRARRHTVRERPRHLHAEGRQRPRSNA